MRSVGGRRVLLIDNPTAGRRHGGRVFALVRALARLDCIVTLHTSRSADEARRVAAAATRDDVDVLAIAGGDGTLSDVLRDLGEGAPPIALVPCGTANVLALEIGVPRGVKALARMIATGPAREVRFGLANGARFAKLLGCGVDAAIVAGVDGRLKRVIGKGAYVVETIRALIAFTPRRYRVTIDGESHEAASVIVTKGRCYAGTYVVAPEADFWDDRLHVGLFARTGRLAFLDYLLAMGRGGLGGRSDFRSIAGRQILIDGPIAEKAQVDGDIRARLPMRIGIDPTAFGLIVPPFSSPAVSGA